MYCDWFLAENVARIGKAFEFVAGWCDFHKLAYVFLFSTDPVRMFLRYFD